GETRGETAEAPAKDLSLVIRSCWLAPGSLDRFCRGLDGEGIGGSLQGLQESNDRFLIGPRQIAKSLDYAIGLACMSAYGGLQVRRTAIVKIRTGIGNAPKRRRLPFDGSGMIIGEGRSSGFILTAIA